MVLINSVLITKALFIRDRLGYESFANTLLINH